MKNQEIVRAFDQKEHANSYDEKTALWSSSSDALFSLIRLIFAELPSNARILCVGVGTGTEMIALAQVFPHWQFTAVEPASAMLGVCQRKAVESGIASRCTFHEGYLDSLPTSDDSFDAATCLLVSQFFKQAEERSHFFSQIAQHLRPNGILINSDLVLGLPPAVHEGLFEIWLQMLGGSAWSEEDIEKMRGVWRQLAALTPPEIEAIIAAGGFNPPVLFFQTLFIHAWFSKRRAV